MHPAHAALSPLPAWRHGERWGTGKRVERFLCGRGGLEACVCESCAARCGRLDNRSTAAAPTCCNAYSGGLQHTNQEPARLAGPTRHKAPPHPAPPRPIPHLSGRSRITLTVWMPRDLASWTITWAGGAGPGRGGGPGKGSSAGRRDLGGGEGPELEPCRPCPAAQAPSTPGPAVPGRPRPPCPALSATGMAACLTLPCPALCPALSPPLPSLPCPPPALPRHLPTHTPCRRWSWPRSG